MFPCSLATILFTEPVFIRDEKTYFPCTLRCLDDPTPQPEEKVGLLSVNTRWTRTAGAESSACLGTGGALRVSPPPSRRLLAERGRTADARSDARFAAQRHGAAEDVSKRAGAEPPSRPAQGGPRTRADHGAGAVTPRSLRAGDGPGRRASRSAGRGARRWAGGCWGRGEQERRG